MKGKAEWIAAGRPETGLARPLAQLRDRMVAHGFTVFWQPDDRHLNAVPPEDHTWYSQTNWPGGQELWWCHAIDIMPGPGGAAELQAIGRRIVADALAGRLPWLKYINWPATGRLDQAQQDAFEGTHTTRSSSDVGHIHLSSTTGVLALDAPYDPIGDDMSSAHTDAVIAAWENGLTTASDGTFVAPVDWEIRHEKFEAAAAASLANLAAAVGALTAKVDALSAGAPPAAGGTVSVTLTGSLSGSGTLTAAPPA